MGYLLLGLAHFFLFLFPSPIPPLSPLSLAIYLSRLVITFFSRDSAAISVTPLRPYFERHNHEDVHKLLQFLTFIYSSPEEQREEQEVQGAAFFPI